ncbi:MAG: glycosyl hydrolase family 65 protein, partial [Burkholderiales bacterium]
GMNSVGEQGRGESSWLAWFLLAAIAAFVPCAERRGDTARARRWRAYATRMRKALESAWDGEWYRRGYYDDGTPLGSHESAQCRIDTIAQSWSVLAGLSSPPNRPHAAQAMASVDRLLVDHTHGATWSIFAWAGLGDGDRAGAMFDLLNPIYHSDSAQAVARYKVEPYVACADVYSVEPHIGRGGWTWYSGSAAWLYRAGLEAMLGFRLCGDQLRIDPCIPEHWPGFQLTYQQRGQLDVITRYEITVENPSHVSQGVILVELDGKTLATKDAIALAGDGQTHSLRLVLGCSEPCPS